MNKHNFQQLAKSFRAGRLSLEQFTRELFEPAAPDLLVENDQVPKLPVRKAEMHKGDFGRLLAIGGSVGMAGAISLTGMAALRSGAGLVKIAVPDRIQSTVASYCSCYMTVGCGDNNGSFAIQSLADMKSDLDWAEVLVLGPGMGRGVAQQEMSAELYRRAGQPTVIDADALNALSDGQVNLGEHAGPRILTPHAGELQRLLRQSYPSRNSLENAAIELSRSYGIIVVLKGHHTLITDGQQSLRNQTGNPGMATGGAGDVLSGMIGALLSQQMSPLNAARLAVHWHGLAGDLVAARIGQHSLIATDLIEALGVAAQQLN
jgi:NAD(P)H-hydrate epimerase